MADRGDDKRCIVCERVADGAPILHAVREAPRRDDDSGWQFLCGSENHGGNPGDEEGLITTVGSVLESEPVLAHFLAAGAGSTLERATWAHAFEWTDVPDETDGAFLCGSCDQVHSGLPMDILFGQPSQYEEDDAELWRLEERVAVWAEEHYFHQALLLLPVLDGATCFSYAVWVSVSPANFPEVARRLREGSGVDEITEGHFGWFSSFIPGFPETLELKSVSRFVPGELLPLVELEPTDHPLARAQHEGITLARVHDLVRDGFE